MSVPAQRPPTPQEMINEQLRKTRQNTPAPVLQELRREPPIYDVNNATGRQRIRSAQIDPWENKLYQRSKSGNYEISQDPNRAINQTPQDKEREGSLDFDVRQRRMMDSTQMRDNEVLQGTMISAWNAQKLKQEQEYAEYYAEAQAIGGTPYYTGGVSSNFSSNGWSIKTLEQLGTGEIRTKIVNAAVSLMGKGIQYSWGGGGAQGPGYGYNGVDPDTNTRYNSASVLGFDCSGLVQYAYAQAGISIPRHSKAQSAFGKIVPTSQLKPGDIVSWGSSPQAASHVAVYLGNGYIAEAANPKDDLQVRKLGTWPMDRQSFGVSVSMLGR